MHSVCTQNLYKKDLVRLANHLHSFPNVDTMAIVTKSHSTLIVSEDGDICAFGNNAYGCLGQGNELFMMGPVWLGHDEVFGGHKVVMVALGATFAGCVTSDGSLWTWGDNFDRTLGMDNALLPGAPGVNFETADRPPSLPTRLCQTMHGNSPITMVAFGDTVSVILTANGDIFHYSFEAPVPVLMDRARFDHALIGMIAVGGTQILALSKSGGRVWSWGGNEKLQTGLGTHAEFVPQPTAVPAHFDGGEVAFISCGYDFSMAVTVDGVLWACGNNENGECGAVDWLESDVFRRIGGPEYFGPGGVHSVSCAGAHTLILANNNSVWSCGYNANGELGSGPHSNEQLVHADVVQIAFPDHPEVPDDNNVVVVAAGGHMSFVVTSGGLVFLWGCKQNWELMLSMPHQLPDWVMGVVPSTSGYCRAGRWHVGNRDRTMAFVQGVAAISPHRIPPGMRVPLGMTELSSDILQYLFENMRLVAPATMGIGVRRLLGLARP